MHAVVTTFSILTSVFIVALLALAVHRWLHRRDRAAGWLTLAFLTLGVIVTVGRLVPSNPHGVAEDALQRFEIELLVLFPYLLYRFATEFVRPSQRLQRVVAVLTIGLSLWTFALPNIPATGEPRPTLFRAYVIVFLAHWTLLSIVVTVRLWRAGREQPSVAANRMRMLSFAAAALTVAIIFTAFATDQASVAALLTQLVALASCIGFVLGLSPPQVVRAYWRQPEQQRLQEAIVGLMTLATTRTEVAQRVLGPVVALVGARGAAILDSDGTVVAEHAPPSDGDGGTPVQLEQPGAKLIVWTSPYAPFFGDDELRILETVTAMTGIALDRVRLFEQEHSSRLALEHANEVMANFVALAAHELRTPVTTVHGFVQTLNHLGDRLDDDQKQELRVALEQQTARMASLVEQLLDLSARRPGDRDRAGDDPSAQPARRGREACGRGACRRGRGLGQWSRRSGRRSRRARAHRHQPGDQRVAIWARAGSRLRSGRRRPAAGVRRGRRAGRCARDSGDVVRALHAGGCRTRPGGRHGARVGDRPRLRSRSPWRAPLRAGQPVGARFVVELPPV